MESEPSHCPCCPVLSCQKVERCVQGNTPVWVLTAHPPSRARHALPLVSKGGLQGNRKSTTSHMMIYGVLMGVWCCLPSSSASSPFTYFLSALVPCLPFFSSFLFSMCQLCVHVFPCACMGAHASTHAFGEQVNVGAFLSP